MRKVGSLIATSALLAGVLCVAGGGGDGIGVGFGSVWLENADAGNVWRIKP